MISVTVGRENSTQPPDICLPASEDSVSRLHLQFTVTDTGRHHVKDLDSANGTWTWTRGAWVRIGEGVVEATGRLRLGSVELDVADILAKVAEVEARRARNAATPRPRRDPLTGQVIVS